MFGIGTLVNTGLVFLGGLIGLVLKKGISEKIQSTLMSACGIASAFIGISGTVAGMLTFENGKFGTTGAMLLIFSLVIGGFFGEIIDIEKHMDKVRADGAVWGYDLQYLLTGLFNQHPRTAIAKIN